MPEHFFHKKPREKEIAETVIFIMMGILTVGFLLEIPNNISFSIVIIVTIIGALFNLWNYSKFRLSSTFMVCSTPLLFWKYKRQFFYKKIKNITIKKNFLTKVCHVRVQLINDKTYTYRLDYKLMDDFIITLQKYDISVYVLSGKHKK